MTQVMYYCHNLGDSPATEVMYKAEIPDDADIGVMLAIGGRCPFHEDREIRAIDFNAGQFMCGREARRACMHKIPPRFAQLDEQDDGSFQLLVRFRNGLRADSWPFRRMSDEEAREALASEGATPVR